MADQHAAALAAEKDELRRRLLAARSALSAEERRRQSAVVCDRLDRLPELAGVRAVLGYAAMAAEVDLDPFLTRLAATGVALHLPWVDGEQLGVAEVDDLEGLSAGWRGVREPPAACRRPVRPERLGAVIAPGVGFDRNGHRLGHGGGHFDRLLARTRRGCVVVGVAFDVQLVTAVPVAVHDRSVDVLVTPAGVLRP